MQISDLWLYRSRDFFCSFNGDKSSNWLSNSQPA